MENKITNDKAVVNLTMSHNGTDAEFLRHCPCAENQDKAFSAKNEKNGKNDLCVKTWRDDPVKKVRRLLEWWRIHHSRFVFFCYSCLSNSACKDLQLCSRARVLSSEIYRLACIGGSGTKNNIECRLIQLVNNYNQVSFIILIF